MLWDFSRNRIIAVSLVRTAHKKCMILWPHRPSIIAVYVAELLTSTAFHSAQLNVSPCPTCRCTRYRFEKYYVSGHLPPDILKAKYKKFPDKHWGGYKGVTQWTRAMSIGACTAGKINKYFTCDFVYKSEARTRTMRTSCGFLNPPCVVSAITWVLWPLSPNYCSEYHSWKQNG